MSFPAAVNVGDLISVVQQAGYTAALPPGGSGGMASPRTGVPGGKHSRTRCCGGYWSRW